MSTLRTPHTLEEWNVLGQTPDADIDLLSAAMLVARDEYPNLDAADYESMLDTHVQEIRQKMPTDAHAQQRLLVLSRYLFEEAGFSGNHDAFYDPRNSYLNEVLERRMGIPLSLALVQMELARRLDVPLEGVSFPGHFLVRLQVEGGLLVLDPYHRGRSVDVEELRQRAIPHVAGTDIDDQQLLEMLAPASNRDIVMRMLRNLKSLYEHQEDFERALRSADRLIRIAPGQADLIRDRGLLYHRIGHLSAARDDLTQYLALAPRADDIDSIRGLVVDSASGPSRLH